MIRKIDCGGGIEITFLLTSGIPDDQMMFVTEEALKRAYEEWSRGQSITLPDREEIARIVGLGKTFSVTTDPYGEPDPIPDDIARALIGYRDSP